MPNVIFSIYISICRVPLLFIDFFFRVCKRWREYSSTEMHINIYREKKRENDENVICLQSEITIGNFVAKSKSSFYAIDTIESNFMCQTRCTMHNFINKSFDSFYNIGQLVFNHEFVVYMWKIGICLCVCIIGHNINQVNGFYNSPFVFILWERWWWWWWCCVLYFSIALHFSFRFDFCAEFILLFVFLLFLIWKVKKESWSVKVAWH